MLISKFHSQTQPPLTLSHSLSLSDPLSLSHPPPILLSLSSSSDSPLSARWRQGSRRRRKSSVSCCSVVVGGRSSGAAISEFRDPRARANIATRSPSLPSLYSRSAESRNRESRSGMADSGSGVMNRRSKLA